MSGEGEVASDVLVVSDSEGEEGAPAAKPPTEKITVGESRKVDLDRMMEDKRLVWGQVEFAKAMDMDFEDLFPRCFKVDA